MKVFISWSGITSRAVAESLANWFPKVIQGVRPFVSAKDIDKGANWTVELARELEDADFGVICLAPDNLLSPWLNYEAGAISKSVASRVCPVLFGVKKADVKPPLSQLQLTDIELDDVTLLMKSMNKVAGAILDDSALEEAVRIWWPTLEAKLGDIEVPNRAEPSAGSSAAEPQKPILDDNEMLVEVLRRVRGLDSRLENLERQARNDGDTLGANAKLRSRQTSLSEDVFDDALELVTGAGLVMTSATYGNGHIGMFVTNTVKEFQSDLRSRLSKFAVGRQTKVALMFTDGEATFETDGSVKESLRDA